MCWSILMMNAHGSTSKQFTTLCDNDLDQSMETRTYRDFTPRGPITENWESSWCQLCCNWSYKCVTNWVLYQVFYSTRRSYLNRALQWRHNGRDGISNHQPPDCFLNCLFRCKSKKTSKLRVTGLYDVCILTNNFQCMSLSKLLTITLDRLKIKGHTC